MKNDDRYWQMFTESGDPLAYMEYKKNILKLKKQTPKHENV